MAHTVQNDQGKLMCRACVPKKSTAVRTADYVLKRVSELQVKCLHCELVVTFSHAKSHLEKHCTQVTRSLQDQVHLMYFDICQRMQQDLSITDTRVLLQPADGLSLFEHLKSVLAPAKAGYPEEQGLIATDCFYVTNYGRVIYWTQGMLMSTTQADIVPLPIKVQSWLSRAPLTVYAAQPPLLHQTLEAWVVVERMSDIETHLGTRFTVVPGATAGAV
jgi:hypothetical protein